MNTKICCKLLLCYFGRKLEEFSFFFILWIMKYHKLMIIYYHLILCVILLKNIIIMKNCTVLNNCKNLNHYCIYKTPQNEFSLTWVYIRSSWREFLPTRHWFCSRLESPELPESQSSVTLATLVRNRTNLRNENEKLSSFLLEMSSKCIDLNWLTTKSAHTMCTHKTRQDKHVHSYTRTITITQSINHLLELHSVQCRHTEYYSWHPEWFDIKAKDSAVLRF